MGIILFDNNASFALLTSHTPFTTLSQPLLKIENTKKHKNKKIQIPKLQERNIIKVIMILLVCLNLSLILILSI